MTNIPMNRFAMTTSCGCIFKRRIDGHWGMGRAELRRDWGGRYRLKKYGLKKYGLKKYRRQARGSGWCSAFLEEGGTPQKDAKARNGCLWKNQ
jgi:hypothetical protein